MLKHHARHGRDQTSDRLVAPIAPARQPIFGAALDVIGHELLHRPALPASRLCLSRWIALARRGTTEELLAVPAAG